jgi:hypothetical protein
MLHMFSIAWPELHKYKHGNNCLLKIAQLLLLLRL